MADCNEEMASGEDTPSCTDGLGENTENSNNHEVNNHDILTNHCSVDQKENDVTQSCANNVAIKEPTDENNHVAISNDVDLKTSNDVELNEASPANNISTVNQETKSSHSESQSDSQNDSGVKIDIEHEVDESENNLSEVFIKDMETKEDTNKDTNKESQSKDSCSDTEMKSVNKDTAVEPESSLRTGCEAESLMDAEMIEFYKAINEPLPGLDASSGGGGEAGGGGGPASSSSSGKDMFVDAQDDNSNDSYRSMEQVGYNVYNNIICVLL